MALSVSLCVLAIVRIYIRTFFVLRNWWHSCNILNRLSGITWRHYVFASTLASNWPNNRTRRRTKNYVFSGKLSYDSTFFLFLCLSDRWLRLSALRGQPSQRRGRKESCVSKGSQLSEYHIHLLIVQRREREWKKDTDRTNPRQEAPIKTSESKKKIKLKYWNFFRIYSIMLKRVRIRFVELQITKESAE